MLDERQLGAHIDQRFTHTLFRLETLDQYDVGSDGDDLRRYLDGEPGPDLDRKGPWMEHIRGEVARGLHTYRVHVVNGPLTDYLRFEFEWGYVYNSAAGERIRILDLSEQARPDNHLNEDFWLIDDEQVIRMHYTSTGKFIGAEIVTDDAAQRYRAARDTVWKAAVPFADYWQAHPRYWRDRPAL